MRVDKIIKIIKSRPIGILTIASLLMGGLSIASAELGRFFEFSPLHSMSIFYIIAIFAMVRTAEYFKTYKILHQKHISRRALIYGALWLLPVAYALWLNSSPIYESLVYKNIMMEIGHVIASTAYQEILYRGVVLLLLINILLPKHYPFAYIVLVGAVLSALPQLYMLLTPAPPLYVLYQIMWATLHGMVAVYAMLLWRNLGVIIALNVITKLYAGFDAPVLGVPAMYVSLLWFAILAMIGRMLCKTSDMENLLIPHKKNTDK